jgi:hypothetical protein
MADSPYDAIRSYLEWTAQGLPPVRNDERIAELEQQAEQADDVLDKLRILSELERATGSDHAEELRQGFVDNARQWAEQNDVSPDAFRRLGVPDEDLRAAGLLRQRGRRRSSGGRHGGGRRSRVSRDDILAALPGGTFTKSDLVEASGASPGTVTSALHEAVEAGRVRMVGPDPNHSSRGRAPILYETAS